MKNERQIAELIFDKFRTAKCKAGDIVMFRVFQHTLIDTLNPKERALFLTVFHGLIFTGYFTYESDSSVCVRLTEKGYDYIYDDEKITAMLQKPWIIPSMDNTDWNKAYYKLWKVIGPRDTATHYIDGSQFYKLVMALCDDLPPTYTLYIDQRKKKDLSTSRVEYYNDLINHLGEEKRRELYVNIQLFLEDSTAAKDVTTDDFSFDTISGWSDANTESVEVGFVKQIETVNVVEPTEKAPVVFISYSWDSPAHEEWVLNLACKLREYGVDAILDKWDLGPLGKPLPRFMESAISKSQRVVCVMTPNYKRKTENLAGGVGYEYSIISAALLYDDITTSKFIPLLRDGTDAESIPVALKGRKYVDMRDDSQFDEQLIHELLRDIHNVPKFKKPGIGVKPKFD